MNLTWKLQTLETQHRELINSLRATHQIKLLVCPHLLFSVVQVWAGCGGAGSSVCTRFWGFCLVLVQLFVLSNFFTI